MSKYIDAEWLKAFFEADKGKNRNVPIDILLALIDSAPSIDIVRCSECKYCHYEQENDVYHCYKLFHRFYDANKHFCSYGEREGE